MDSTDVENEAENAATELTIKFDTESLNNTTLSYFSDNDDEGTTTLSPPTPPPPPLLSEEPIVPMEVIDTNTAAEELDQTTSFTTPPTTGDEITQDEPEVKKEILNELQNIWYYTEELGDDQNSLKSSLSSLIHMTYARVYDQSDETLVRLKFLLRRLRAKLLGQPTQIDADTIADNPPTTIVTPYGEVNDIPNENSDTITINAHHPLKSSADNSNQTVQTRDKRSLVQQKDKIQIFANNVDPDDNENSLFPPLSSDNNKKLFYSHVKEVTVPKIPSILDSHHGSRETLREKVMENSNTLLDEDVKRGDFVHVTIFQPDKKNGTIISIPTSTMKPPLFSSQSQFSSNIKPHTNAKYQDILHFNVPQLKQKYKIVKTTPKPRTHVKNLMTGDGNNSPPTSISTMDDIIQSIIEVLRSPIPKPNYFSSASSHEIKNPVASLFPTFTSNKNKNNSEASFSDQPVFDSLPSYLEKIAAGLGLGNFSNYNDLHDSSGKNFTKVSMIRNSALTSLKNENGTEDNSTLEDVFDDDGGDLLLTPTSVMNGTVEKVFEVINVFANLPNKSGKSGRFILFFSITISIASIAVGLYSLGPPIVAVGVLGIVVPILLLFLVQNSAGKKKKAKTDILNQLKVDDFFQALDMIADAMIKYEKKV